MKTFKYDIKDKVRYDQGPKSYHHRGVGTVVRQNGDFLDCVAYLLEDDTGFKVEVTEEQILGKA